MDDAQLHQARLIQPRVPLNEQLMEQQSSEQAEYAQVTNKQKVPKEADILVLNKDSSADFGEGATDGDGQYRPARAAGAAPSQRQRDPVAGGMQYANTSTNQ